MFTINKGFPLLFIKKLSFHLHNNKSNFYVSSLLRTKSIETLTTVALSSEGESQRKPVSKLCLTNPQPVVTLRVVIRIFQTNSNTIRQLCRNYFQLYT